MTEAEFERILDSRVMRRVATDTAYHNAADAETQKQREETIEQEEYVTMLEEFGAEEPTGV